MRGMTGRRRLATVLALASMLVIAGCAEIPTESAPHAVGREGAPEPGVVTEPTRNAHPLDLVREFVRAAGTPQAAKAYMTKDARDDWPAEAPPTVIEETFNTVPPPPRQELEALGEDARGEEYTVVLAVRVIGQLGSDRAFVPNPERPTMEKRVKLRRQPNNQWRITDPPDMVFITKPDFLTSYRVANVYFFDQRQEVAVPDVRYVPAEPSAGLHDRVLDLLLEGPSTTLDGAVTTLLEGAELRQNLAIDADNVLQVDLTGLGGRTEAERTLIAAQVALTLHGISANPVRIEVDGAPLVAEHPEWRRGDLASYDVLTKPAADLSGMAVLDNRVYSLDDGSPIPGQAGAGEYQVVSAAQSLDGKRLALVDRDGTGVRLMVGDLASPSNEVDLPAKSMTRPTWLHGSAPGEPSNEVWTALNGDSVARVVYTEEDGWVPIEVNATELKRLGKITELRLSRDGVRLAAIVGGKLVVATVVRDEESVTIRSPRVLQPELVVNGAGVAWLSQTELVVATGHAGHPIVNIPVDGIDYGQHNNANLSVPVTAVAAAPDRPIVVADAQGLSEVTEPGQVWRPNDPRMGSGAVPFYPG